MHENPYSSPIEAPCDRVPANTRGITRAIVTFGTVCFWLGVMHALLGSIVTFVPGAECGWYIFSGVLISFGLIVPKRRYRIAAVILASLCFAGAYSGYVRGVEYRKWLNEQDDLLPLQTPHNMTCPHGPIRKSAFEL